MKLTSWRGVSRQENLQASSDEEDDLPAITASGEKARPDANNIDSLYDEVDDDVRAQQELYEAYANQCENELLMEYKFDDDMPQKKESEVEEKESSNIDDDDDQPPTTGLNTEESEGGTDRTIKESNRMETTDATSIELTEYQNDEKSNKETVDGPEITTTITNAKGFTESEIHEKRKIIIEEITKKPEIIKEDTTGTINLDFISGVIQNLPPPTDNEETVSDSDTSSEQQLLVAFDEHVSKIAQKHRNIYEANAAEHFESEDSNSNCDDLENFITNIEEQMTVRNFLTGYDTFLNEMQSRFDDSHQFRYPNEPPATNNNNNSENNDLNNENHQSSATCGNDNDLDLDTIHQHLLLAPEINQTDDSKSASRMLPRQKPIFDLTLDDINTELEVLEDNAHNGLVDMVDRIYKNRDLYRRVHSDDEDDDSEGEEATDDDTPNFIKNYYEDFCGFEKSETASTSSTVLDQLRNLNEARERRTGVRFYCNNLYDFLDVKDDIEEEPVSIVEQPDHDGSNSEIKNEPRKDPDEQLGDTEGSEVVEKSKKLEPEEDPESNITIQQDIKEKNSSSIGKIPSIDDSEVAYPKVSLVSSKQNEFNRFLPSQLSIEEIIEVDDQTGVHGDSQFDDENHQTINIITNSEVADKNQGTEDSVVEDLSANIGLCSVNPIPEILPSDHTPNIKIDATNENEVSYETLKEKVTLKTVVDSFGFTKSIKQMEEEGFKEIRDSTSVALKTTEAAAYESVANEKTIEIAEVDTARLSITNPCENTKVSNEIKELIDTTEVVETKEIEESENKTENIEIKTKEPVEIKKYNKLVEEETKKIEEIIKKDPNEEDFLKETDEPKEMSEMQTSAKDVTKENKKIKELIKDFSEDFNNKVEEILNETDESYQVKESFKIIEETKEIVEILKTVENPNETKEITEKCSTITKQNDETKTNHDENGEIEEVNVDIKDQGSINTTEITIKSTEESKIISNVSSELCGNINKSLIQVSPVIPEPTKDCTLSKEISPDDEEVARISRLDYIQSLLFSAPKLSSIVSAEPVFEVGEFGLDAEGARQATEELQQCPIYQNHLRRLEALDKELDANIDRIMLDASIEHAMLKGLEQYGDPFDDNETDISVRAQKYADEFRDRVRLAKEQKK